MKKKLMTLKIQIFKLKFF